MSFEVQVSDGTGRGGGGGVVKGKGGGQEGGFGARPSSGRV